MARIARFVAPGRPHHITQRGNRRSTEEGVGAYPPGLDEATAALDYESERLFQTNLKRIAIGRTLVMIAHRLSTVRHADLILVMDHGTLVEAGPPDELIKQNGAFAALLRMSGMGG